MFILLLDLLRYRSCLLSEVLHYIDEGRVFWGHHEQTGSNLCN